MATLDLVLESLPEPDVRFAMALDAPLYFSVHSGVARLAESDRVVIHAARYLDGTEQTDSRAAIETYLDRVQPRWRERVCHRRYLPKIAVHVSLRSMVRVPTSKLETDSLLRATGWGSKACLRMPRLPAGHAPPLRC